MAAIPNSLPTDHTSSPQDSTSTLSNFSLTDLVRYDTIHSEEEEEGERVTAIDMEQEHLSLQRKHKRIMDMIPEEAESLTVLVGGVKFLEQSVTAFVRLKQVRIIAMESNVLTVHRG